MPGPSAKDGSHSPDFDRPDTDRFGTLVHAVARDRDRMAFAALFRHFAPKILQYCLKLGADRGTAEELVQDVMLTVWLKAGSFDPAQATVGTWVFTIARNRRIDHLRKEMRPAPDPDDPAMTPASHATPEESAQLVQSSRQLHDAIGSLAANQSEVLRRSYFLEQTHEEIAKDTAVPLGTVKTRLRLALQHLKSSLRDEA
ncbi:RNA polymerase sigma-70 factor (ECF subfamily) [Azospirillum lipoferum]|uniref:sigma-70 family RNA polymerase sigma factor n=1 Tax=Azospirillum TaxID=191 RepID=UPI001FE3BF04|nr:MULTISPECIES: sigma-70 family RNA polymerase sigma factor [Azospirillum]MCP1613249.1 RNA polymerase sigma-70 factor (ECF subfamily) [Azospirillum lipoferum]MDW5531448.1 sigma-70 family RNA polymerase sigma factor [Azospirillum sp. NL1]